MNWMRILTWSVAGVAGIFLILFGVLVWVSDPWRLSAPSDEKLITIFNDHQKAFEKLASMANEDWPTNFVFSLRYLDDGLVENRKELYRQYISQIDRKLVVTVGPGKVVFKFASGGLLAVGPEWDKGIVYFPFGGGPGDDWKTLPKLNNLNGLAYGYYVRPIEKHWYIIYENIP